MKLTFDEFVKFYEKNILSINITLFAVLFVLLYILKNIININILEGNRNRNIDMEINASKSRNKETGKNGALKEEMGDDEGEAKGLGEKLEND